MGGYHSYREDCKDKYDKVISLSFYQKQKILHEILDFSCIIFMLEFVVNVGKTTSSLRYLGVTTWNSWFSWPVRDMSRIFGFCKW